MPFAYHLFYGIDGRNGLPAFVEEKVDRVSACKKYGRHLSNGELACALSHQGIYQLIVARGWPGAIVLEDDAILTDCFRDFVKYQYYTQADFIMLDHSHARVRRKVIELSADIRCMRLTLPSCLTTGYALTADAARFLIKAGTPLSDVADWPADVTEFGALACVPTIVGHQDPATGKSHLRHERNRGKLDPGRLFRASYWKVWAKKRLSYRIS